MAWVYIIIAAAFEAAWTFSLKLLNFSAFKNLCWDNFFTPDIGLPIMLPLAGYIIFGIGNVYFFSLAIKQLPTAVAYALWTAITIVLIKLSEVMFLRQRIALPEIGFILLIMVGIMGLKYYTIK